MEITGKQKRYLRGLGHHLRPVLHIGKAGVAENVVRQARDALESHELIKVRFLDGFEARPRDGAEELARATDAALAGRIGRTALLYRPREEDPEIRLPGDGENPGRE